jgi:Rod binding domain-containing protein
MMIEQTIAHTSQSAPATTTADDKQKARLKSAAKDFEAIFLAYMLRSMRSSLSTNDMFGESFGGDLTEGMFDSELAREISTGKSFGLGEMMYQHLTGTRTNSKGAEAPSSEIETVHPAPSEKRIEQKPEGAKPSHTEALGEFESIIEEAASKHGVDPSLIKALIMSESSGNTMAESDSSAKGLMQLMDTTAAELGVKDVWDPRQNIMGGTQYLRTLIDRFDGDLTLALASYNAGPGAVARYGGVPPFKETRSYIERVNQLLEHFKSERAENGSNG